MTFSKHTFVNRLVDSREVRIGFVAFDKSVKNIRTEADDSGAKDVSIYLVL